MTKPTDTELYGERIAFASSKTPGGGAQRWSELSVFYNLKEGDRGRPWTAIARGMSNLAHERTKETVITVGTLERALKLFDEGTQLGRAVRLQAQDWAEGIGRCVTDFERAFASQDEALHWLYGDELDKAKPATLIARDFGAGESTVRAALAAGREIKIPLTAALRFFDRAAFERFRESARG